MILTEDGLRKIISEVLKVSRRTGRYASTDRQFRCDLSNLEDSRLIFFLNRAIIFEPEGVSEKSFLEKLDRFLTTGMAMTPLENEQYNNSIEATLDRNPSLKRKMVKRLEMALDIAFFPTAAPVCRIINGFYSGEKFSTSRDRSESFDPLLFENLISDASEKMANVLSLDRLLSNSEPHNLFFFPVTYKALSDGKSTSDVADEHNREKQYLINQIDREGLTVKELYKVLSKMHRNTGITVRDRRFYMQNFEDYFRRLMSSGQEEDIGIAVEIREEIVRLVNLHFRL